MSGKDCEIQSFLSNGQHTSVSYGEIMDLVKKPVLPDAFALDDVTKMSLIEEHFSAIMSVLSLDSSRGVRDSGSSTLMIAYCGKYRQPDTPNEFLS